MEPHKVKSVIFVLYFAKKKTDASISAHIVVILLILYLEHVKLRNCLTFRLALSFVCLFISRAKFCTQ